MKKYQRKHWIIFKCDFCGAEDLPREMRFSKKGSPKKQEIPEGWGYTGCLDNNNFRVWCPDHAGPKVSMVQHTISPPIKPLSPKEIKIIQSWT